MELKLRTADLVPASRFHRKTEVLKWTVCLAQGHPANYRPEIRGQSSQFELGVEIPWPKRCWFWALPQRSVCIRGFGAGPPIRNVPAAPVGVG